MAHILPTHAHEVQLPAKWMQAILSKLNRLNHTCAMLRANINRLIRRSWSTTKNAENLAHHLTIYVNYHNECLTPPLQLGA